MAASKRGVGTVMGFNGEGLPVAETCMQASKKMTAAMEWECLGFLASGRATLASGKLGSFTDRGCIGRLMGASMLAHLRWIRDMGGGWYSGRTIRGWL